MQCFRSESSCLQSVWRSFLDEELCLLLAFLLCGNAIKEHMRREITIYWWADWDFAWANEGAAD